MGSSPLLMVPEQVGGGGVLSFQLRQEEKVPGGAVGVSASWRSPGDHLGCTTVAGSAAPAQSCREPRGGREWGGEQSCSQG